MSVMVGSGFGGGPLQSTIDLGVTKSTPGFTLTGTEAGNLTVDVREEYGSAWISMNTEYVPGVGYQQINAAQASTAIVMTPSNTGSTLQFASAPAGASFPIVWSFTPIIPSTLSLPYIVLNYPPYNIDKTGVLDASGPATTASLYAGPNAVLLCLPGTYRAATPFVPQAPGQKMKGSGWTCEDATGIPGEGGTTWTVIPNTEIASGNYYAKCIFDYLPGTSTGHEITVAQTDNFQLEDLTIDAQARNISNANIGYNGLGCCRTGENWQATRVRFHDGHYFHCFNAGNACHIWNCQFTGGDAFQDLMSGGGSFHNVHDNVWAADASYNGTIVNGVLQPGQQSGANNHNAWDCEGSLSRFRQYGVPTVGNPYNGEGSPPVGVRCERNVIYGNQVIIFESAKKSYICDNSFFGGGHIVAQSNTHYGYNTFDNIEELWICRNVFEPLTYISHGVDIIVYMDSPISPNTGTQTKGGKVYILDNQIGFSTQCSILYAGESTTTSYGGSQIGRNSIVNPNCGAAVNVTISPNGGLPGIATCAAINVTNYVNMQIFENSILDNRATVLMQVPICIGYEPNNSSTITPGGTCRVFGNEGSGFTYGLQYLILFQNLVGAVLGTGEYNLPDCRDNKGWPPMYQAVSIASGTTYTNSTGREQLIYFSGGGATFSVMQINGHSPFGGSLPTYLIIPLNPGETMLFTWTGGTPIFNGLLRV